MCNQPIESFLIVCCRVVVNQKASIFVSYVITEFAHGCTWEVWRALKKLELLSAAPRATLTHLSCSPNFPRASITRYTHAKHKQILNYNIARVLALYKSYWAAMNKIFIYARPCVNKMTWAFFFTWLQEARVALGYRLLQLLRIFRALQTSRVHP